MNKTLPHITNKQSEILHYIYTYRFLTTLQIQQLLNHKSKNRITSWLKELHHKEYLHRIYNPTDFITKTKPAIYYLDLNGVRYLRRLDKQNNTDDYPEPELRKRYKESTRTQSFIDKSLMIVDCVLTLQAASDNKNVSYKTYTAAEYSQDDDYELLNELQPDLYFTKINDKTNEQINYLLNLFDATTPRYMIRKKLKQHIEYLYEDDEAVVLLAFQSLPEMVYAKRRARFLLQDEDEEMDPRLRFTTYEKIDELGVNGATWEEL